MRISYMGNVKIRIDIRNILSFSLHSDIFNCIYIYIYIELRKNAFAHMFMISWARMATEQRPTTHSKKMHLTTSAECSHNSLAALGVSYLNKSTISSIRTPHGPRNKTLYGFLRECICDTRSLKCLWR